MKYFTPEWHSGNVDEHPAEKYQEHLAPLLPQWPPDVQALATSISLHDGLIRELSWNTDEATLFLRLRCGDLQVGCFDLDLHYSGVLFLPTDLENLAALKSSKVGEALYDEMDKEDRYFAHRILFISRERLKGGWFEYYEVAIKFEELHLLITPCESRFDASR